MRCLDGRRPRGDARIGVANSSQEQRGARGVEVRAQLVDVDLLDLHERPSGISEGNRTQPRKYMHRVDRGSQLGQMRGLDDGRFSVQWFVGEDHSCGEVGRAVRTRVRPPARADFVEI